MRTNGSLPLESPRVVVIVARDRPELYDYLVRGFIGVDDVQIIVDRRLPEPPGEVPRAPGEPGDQWTPDVYDELMLRGFVIRRLVDASSEPGQPHSSSHGDRLEGADPDDREILAEIRRQEHLAAAPHRQEGGPEGVKW